MTRPALSELEADSGSNSQPGKGGPEEARPERGKATSGPGEPSLPASPGAPASPPPPVALLLLACLGPWKRWLPGGPQTRLPPGWAAAVTPGKLPDPTEPQLPHPQMGVTVLASRGVEVVDTVEEGQPADGCAVTQDLTVRAGPGGCLLNSFISLSWLPWVCTAAQAFPWSWRASAASPRLPLRSLALGRVGFSSCLWAWA